MRLKSLRRNLLHKSERPAGFADTGAIVEPCDLRSGSLKRSSKPVKKRRPTGLRAFFKTIYGATHAEDGLITTRLATFLENERFVAAYNAGKSTGSWGQSELRWRVFVACWAASHARELEGDFVECGVSRGGISRAVMEYIGFQGLGKTFYLLDTYCGIPERMKETTARVAFDYSECFADVEKTFSCFPNVRLIRGMVPETLAHVKADSVAYLSLDMNCAEPEIAAAEFFWEKLSPGALVLLDDYCYSGEYNLQYQAFNKFAKSKGVEVLPLPTGQGLIVKRGNQSSK